MKIRVFKITTRDPGAFLIERDLTGAIGSLEAFLPDANLGSAYTVEVVEMEEAEVDALPEFEGW